MGQNTLTLMVKVDDEMLRDVIKGLPDMERAFAEILMERNRQDNQWGGPDHDDTHAAEDWGRYIQYQLNHAKNLAHDVRLNDTPISDGTFRGRMVKIAALAVAAIQSIDRKESQS